MWFKRSVSRMLLRIKKIANAFGYDIKRYHPVWESTIKPLGIGTIIDVGANAGVFSRHMRRMFPEAQIYAFEPLADCYRQLVSSMTGDKRFHAWNIALGDADGTTHIQRSSFHPSSSLLPMTDLHKILYPKSKDTNPEKITVRRLDAVLNTAPLPPRTLIKIDVQGLEDKVIVGGVNILTDATVIIVETSFVPLYEHQPLFGDIYTRLSGLGFSYYGDLGRHYSRISKKLIYEDSLFIKKEKVTP